MGKLPGEISYLSVGVLAMLYVVGIIITSTFYDRAMHLLAPEQMFSENLLNDSWIDQLEDEDLLLNVTLGEMQPPQIIQDMQDAMAKQMVRGGGAEGFSLVQHLPGVIQPWFPQDLKDCHSPPWGAYPTIQHHCVVDLLRSVHAFLGALYETQQAPMQCTIVFRGPASPIGPRSEVIKQFSMPEGYPNFAFGDNAKPEKRYDVRATPYGKEGIREASRVGMFGNLVEFEGSHVTTLVEEGVLVRIVSAIGQISGHYTEIVSPETFDALDALSPVHYLRTACGWKGKTIVVASPRSSILHRASLAARMNEFAEQSRTVESMSYSMLLNRVTHHLNIGKSSKSRGQHNPLETAGISTSDVATAHEIFDHEHHDNASGAKLDLLVVNLGNSNGFHVTKEILSQVAPSILLLRYSMAIGDVNDRVAKRDFASQHPSWDGTCYYGASITSYHILARRFGYKVVHVTATNIFLVHRVVFQSYTSASFTRRFPSAQSLYRRQTLFQHFGGYDAPAVQRTVADCEKRWDSMEYVTAADIFS